MAFQMMLGENLVSPGHVSPTWVPTLPSQPGHLPYPAMILELPLALQVPCDMDRYSEPLPLT